jgi:response regulator RpfG family c-di-GMP phosphodiesterase
MGERERVNILLVDDDPAKLLSYEAILSELGEHLITARSGRGALQHLLNHEIAAIVLDVNMPEMDGFELAKLIRAHPRYQETAMILGFFAQPLSCRAPHEGGHAESQIMPSYSMGPLCCAMPSTGCFSPSSP